MSRQKRDCPVLTDSLAGSRQFHPENNPAQTTNTAPCRIWRPGSRFWLSWNERYFQTSICARQYESNQLAWQRTMPFDQCHTWRVDRDDQGVKSVLGRSRALESHAQLRLSIWLKKEKTIITVFSIFVQLTGLILSGRVNCPVNATDTARCDHFQVGLLFD